MAKCSMSFEDITDINVKISVDTSSISERPISSSVFLIRNISEAFRHIFNGKKFHVNDQILKENENFILEMMGLLRQYPDTMFSCLQEHFAKHFDINLLIIAFRNGKFVLIPKENNERRYLVCLVFDQRDVLHGILYTIDHDGTVQTVFNASDYSVNVDAHLHVMRLNETIREQVVVNCEQELNEENNISPSSNQFLPPDSVHINDQTPSQMMINQMLPYFTRTIEHLPINSDLLCQNIQEFITRIHALGHPSSQNAITGCKELINCLWNLVGLVEPVAMNFDNQMFSQIEQIQLQPFTAAYDQNISIQASMERGCLNDRTPFSASIVDPCAVAYVDTRQQQAIDGRSIYEAPTPTKLFESTIHPRTLKEFASSRSNPVKCVDSHQRDPIVINVPTADDTRLHLEVGVDDVHYQVHLSKIVVPKGTKVDNECLMNINDLTCLDFSECDDISPPEFRDKRIYFPITLEEQKIQQKGIRIHMICLYQRGDITRREVQLRQLNKCRISLRLCVLENGMYIRVSPVWHSNIIEDHSRHTSQQRTKQSRETSIDVQ